MTFSMLGLGQFNGTKAQDYDRKKGPRVGLCVL